MERNSGVLPGTPFGLMNGYDYPNTGQTDSAVFGQRQVSNCRPEAGTNYLADASSNDPNWIEKDLYNLLDESGRGLAPKTTSYSTSTSHLNVLQGHRTHVSSMTELSPSTPVETCLADQQRENLSSVFPPTNCIIPQPFAEPYAQPVDNSFSHLWQQRQVSNTGSETVDGYLSKPTPSGDHVVSAPVNLMENLSIGELSGAVSIPNFWPPAAEASADPVQTQDFAPPQTPHASKPVSSTNHNEGVITAADLESSAADVHSSQQLPAFLRKKILISHWDLLANYAKSHQGGTKQWAKAWQNALDFALQCSEEDYHYNLNVAKALTRLKHMNRAKEILLDQLATSNDQRYLLGVNKQLGFLFYKEQSYITSIKYFMRGFVGTMDVPNDTYSFIHSAMKQTIRMCDDKQFVTNAVCWFNYLQPKTRKNKVEISNFIFPLYYSSMSFLGTAPTYTEYLPPDQMKWAITRWKDLESLAASLKPGDPNWFTSWTCALNFALECKKLNYHFNLNVAIALTRLNQLDLAIDTLFQQLYVPEYASDHTYLMAINKQLGFIFFRKGEYLDSIHYYMNCFDGSRALADKTYQYITIAMRAFQDDVDPEFSRSANDWYNRLYSQSMEDKRLFGKKRTSVTKAPLLPLDSASV
ncbi:hypothetical protein [Endozoicomonas sp. GU-1]|uniref:hypothetical protein n=1 Tax=Endozoicomonas sp. GU-1 TaxID=3009078 RepID=UPI0022B4DC01|nr:hypothetical protein [Endozoicomonas sp. GU-1]WBA81129.1 hypothetical protein O2T12_22990 [Endozoicomonas sp. GU-1]WBA88695.1 hypothetical protein O3276_12175 [Endozoicomonas sp. GU-1]